MTKAEILLTMHAKEPLRLFHTMELGGSMTQLAKMEAEGLIESQQRYGRRGGRMRDWFLTEEQHATLPKHELYKTGDVGAPEQIKDRNGEVVLGLCRRCGRAEIELSEPCAPMIAEQRHGEK